ncbi:uncharacterized protein LOC132183923 [Corylus avellana]|uniref:uncharacterized protein LOC132183923 n=1 Tax=Corylus avellana TaxID=13451 RepID=UPI001E235D8D|nr:uncharacterized protein LOC132183923 [Corylus avellana]
MEVVIPGSTMDFDFNSSRSSSPFLSTPTSPKRFGERFFSAPTSPTRVSEFYRDFDEYLVMNDRYEREEREEKRGPGTPKSPKGRATRVEDDFAFDVGEDQLQRDSLSAEELFDGGKIRRKLDAYTTPNSPLLSPKSASSRAKKTILGALSPRRNKEEEKTEQQRGRERNPALSSSNSGRRATRSLSPYRAFESVWEEEEEEENTQQSSRQTPVNSKATFSSTTSSLSSSSKTSKKWSLKDFLLFRSASEGRATDRDPFQKYSPLYKKEDKNWSFRSTESSHSVRTSSRKGPVSAHELHYTKNKAVSEDLKKKTFLPYKQGILGRLAFNPAVHALANGFGSLGGRS